MTERKLTPAAEAALGRTGYPVILGGDHAAFEAEHAGMPPENRPDWPLPSFNAQDWAKAFCKVANSFGYKDKDGNPIDEGWMITWFANALMRGYDEHAARMTRDDTEAPHPSD